MNVNNVSVKIKNNGQLFDTGHYNSPAGLVTVSALYNAAVWAGGVDRAGNVKSAGIANPGDGFDYFSGPLDENGRVDEISCGQWDEIFTVRGSNITKVIDLYKQFIEGGGSIDCNLIPEDVLYWPAQGNPFFIEKYGWPLPDQSLAGFWDMDENGKYDPCKGDYPWVEDYNCYPYHSHGVQIPSEINFYIFNDVGGSQTFTGPSPIQMEFQVHVFAYASNDELNDMTFFQYKLINKAQEDLVDFYFGLWVDPDLGCAVDDYAGCDPETGLAYVYNAGSADGKTNMACDGLPSYGSDIPVVGFDFLRGPMVSKVYARKENGEIIRDLYGVPFLLDPPPGSGTQDTLVEGKLSSFMVFSDCPKEIEYIGTPQCLQARFYNHLRGYWSDNSPIYYGGDGFHQDSMKTTKYMYSDDPSKTDGWSMCSAGMAGGEIMFLMSAGPMLFQPGQHNILRLGVISAHGVHHPCPDITKLKYATLYAENRFNDCFEFEPFSSPEHPDLIGKELDRKVVLALDNYEEIEDYNERILSVPTPFDNNYRFEGYKIFQLRHDSVRGDQLNDQSLARLVAQSDVKNGVKDIYNWYFVATPDTTHENFTWEKRLMVSGTDEGIETSFVVERDLFAEAGNDTLVNGKKYHYCAISYAHNNWRQFDPLEKYGQKRAYLQLPIVRKIYTFSPSRKEPQEELNLSLTRISGEGNPGTFLELTADMHDKIFSQEFDGKISYDQGHGPVLIKVLDPSIIDTTGRYRLELDGTFDHSSCTYADTAAWKLTNITNGKVLLEKVPLTEAREYSFWDEGFSVFLKNGDDPGGQTSSGNGGIGSRTKYTDTEKIKWFDAVREGGTIRQSVYEVADFTTSKSKDPFKELCKLGEGYFMPFNATKTGIISVDSTGFFSPASSLPNTYLFESFADLNNVDIIFTRDTTKWSKCIVIETTHPVLRSEGYQTVGNAYTWSLRRSPSIYQDGTLRSDGTYGFSYFPGYAVDVETGKRLNIFFGESSVLDIGKDLVFNPSDDLIDSTLLQQHDWRGYAFGGHHYIYITKTRYDGCESMGKLLGAYSEPNDSFLSKYKISRMVTWVSMPVCKGLLPLAERLIPNELNIQLRVNNSFSRSKDFKAESLANCLTIEDKPVYEFGFENFKQVNVNNVLDSGNIRVFPNPASTASLDFTLTIQNIREPGEIILYGPDGRVLQQIDTAKTVVTTDNEGTRNHSIELKGLKLSAGLHYVKYTSKSTGLSKVFKWMVL